MKQYNKILEAINRGINLALDDFDNDQELIGQQTQNIKDTHYTKNLLNLLNSFVDFGLPSGTLWCKYNLGVNLENLEDQEWWYDLGLQTPKDWYGDFYQWGSIKPIEYNTKKYNGYSDTYSKYTVKDNLSQLLPEDDAVYQNMHIGNYKCYIPTKEQYEELLKYTEHKYVQNYCDIKGLNGVVFTEKYHDDELFFPTCGYYDMVQKEFRYTTYLFTLTSTRVFSQSTSDRVYTLHGYFSNFTNTFDLKVDWAQRTVACPIRPVTKLK